MSEHWTTETELLAQMVEELSVLASDHRYRKPREVPRPERKAPAGDPAAASANVQKIAKVFSLAGRVRRG